MKEIIGITFLLWIFSEMFLYCLVENKIDKLKRRLNVEGINDRYIKERFEDSLIWYEEYAYIYRYKFILYSMVNIILSSSIPLLTLWDGKVFELETSILIAFLSTVISIISGYLYLREVKNKWYEYRKHAELLKGSYSNKIRRSLSDNDFLGELEAILNQENENWYSVLYQSERNNNSNNNENNNGNN